MTYYYWWPPTTPSPLAACVDDSEIDVLTSLQWWRANSQYQCGVASICVCDKHARSLEHMEYT